MHEAGTHHLQAFERQEGVLVWSRACEHGLAVNLTDSPRVCEKHPDCVERNREEVPEEQERCLFDAEMTVNIRVVMALGRQTHPASKETGSRTQLPPSSKYLKHPVRRTSSIGSGQYMSVSHG